MGGCSVEVTLVRDYCNLPFVSLVMPIRNEAAFIERSLRAMLAQDYPPDRLEVLIVDGISTDGTREVIARTIAAYSDIPVTVLDNPGRIVPVAMNVGIRAAKGDVIIRVDARCFIESNYVTQCVHYLHKTGAWNVGGRQQAEGQGDLISQSIALATTSPFGIGGSKFHYSNKAQYVDTVYLGAYPRWVLDRVGLYDESLVRNQDYELNYRVRAAGGKIYFTPAIRSVYCGRTTLPRLWKQYFQYGYWKVRVLRKHMGSAKVRHLVAPIFVLNLLISIALGIWLSEFLLLGLGITLTYVLAATIASLLAILKTKTNWWCVFLLPFVFASMHISWGCGFLLSLLTMFFRTVVQGIPREQ